MTSIVSSKYDSMVVRNELSSLIWPPTILSVKSSKVTRTNTGELGDVVGVKDVDTTFVGVWVMGDSLGDGVIASVRSEAVGVVIGFMVSLMAEEEGVLVSIGTGASVGRSEGLVVTRKIPKEG